MAGTSELRYAISIKYILDFKDVIGEKEYKMFNTFYKLHIEMIQFSTFWGKQNILLMLSSPVSFYLENMTTRKIEITHVALPVILLDCAGLDPWDRVRSPSPDFFTSPILISLPGGLSVLGSDSYLKEELVVFFRITPITAT